MDKGEKQELENESLDHSKQNEELQAEQELFDIASDKEFQDIFHKIQEQDKAFHNEPIEKDDDL